MGGSFGVVVLLTVLTPTGNRQQSFLKCHEYLMSQTYNGPLRWIVVDDGAVPTIVPQLGGRGELVIVRPAAHWEDGQNTLARNILAGLEFFSGGGLVIMEDDDQYAPWWLDTCEQWLASHALVGEKESLYVHQRTGRATNMNNQQHASLCSTALRDEAVNTLIDVCRTHATGIDMALWKRSPKISKLYAPEPRGVTGIKGGPGRAGIGVGHRLA